MPIAYATKRPVRQMRMPGAVRKYVNSVKALAKRNNILVDLVDTEVLDNTGLPASGYFVDLGDDNTLGELCVAVGNPVEEWFPVLVHESCHMDQFLEASPVWFNVPYVILNGIRLDGQAILDAYIDGLEVPRDALWSAVLSAIAIEHDCERRSLEKIERCGLPIDPIEYAQKANAYIYLYQVAFRERKWSVFGHSPTTVPEVWGVMPTKLLPLRYFRYVPTRYLNLYRRHCLV